jgi:hypothetical protein
MPIIACRGHLALLCLALFLASTAIATAQSAAPLTVRWAGGAFSVRLPDGWQQVTPEDPNTHFEIRSPQAKGNCTVSTRPAEHPRIELYDRAWFEARAAAILKQPLVRGYELKRVGANRGGLGDVVGDIEIAGGPKRFRAQMLFLLEAGQRYTISCFEEVVAYDAVRPAFTTLSESFAFVK